MEIGIVTLFPQMFDALQHGVTGRAVENQLISLNYWNPRDYAQDKHRTVDDRPYGGGPGMLMKIQPLQEAIKTAKIILGPGSTVIYVTPQGRLFNQSAAKTMATKKNLIFVAGRYEGIDERLIKSCIDEKWSIGDYILSGGELAIMVIIDTIARLLPKALGNEKSAQQDSFSEGLLDHPHYTRPETVDGLTVPEILLTGDHQAIETWRLKQALGQTWLKRPDLLKNMTLSAEQEKLLTEFINEYTRRE